MTGRGRQLNHVFFLSPVRLFWGSAVVLILKALFFPVFPSQTRRQGSSKLGIFNLEEHLNSKLTSTRLHLCPSGTGKVDELVVVPLGGT